MLVNIMYNILFVGSRGWALVWAPEILGWACAHPGSPLAPPLDGKEKLKS